LLNYAENPQKVSELVTQTKFSKKDNKKIFPAVPYFSSLISEIDTLKQNSIDQPKQASSNELGNVANE
jgi:hypothetical protein